EWESQSSRLARGLAGAGVVKGDRVAIYLHSTEVLRWVVTYAAVHKVGAVAVPTNTRLVARELEYVLGHAEVVAVVTGGDLEPQLGAVRGSVPSMRLVVGSASWDDCLHDDDSTFQVPLEPDDLADVM